MKTTTLSKSQQTRKTKTILYNTNGETDYAMYFVECSICNLQYVGKNETRFNIRLNIHRKDVKDSKPLLADKHLPKSDHSFNRLARFKVTDKLTNSNLDQEILRENLIQKEGYKN